MYETATNCMSAIKWDKPGKYDTCAFNSAREWRVTRNSDSDTKRTGVCKIQEGKDSVTAKTIAATTY